MSSSAYYKILIDNAARFLHFGAALRSKKILIDLHGIALAGEVVCWISKNNCRSIRFASVFHGLVSNEFRNYRSRHTCFCLFRQRQFIKLICMMREQYLFEFKRAIEMRFDCHLLKSIDSCRVRRKMTKALRRSSASYFNKRKRIQELLSLVNNSESIVDRGAATRSFFWCKVHLSRLSALSLHCDSKWDRLGTLFNLNK